MTFAKTPLRPRNRPARVGGAALLILCLTAAGAAAEEVSTECLFEFNRAYSWNQSGKEQLNLAQQQAAQLNVEAARERYEQAVTLLERSIEQYEQLPELAFDCSPANLSIARNNIRMARQNLKRARESLSGLGCLKSLDELDSLTDLASEYYYERSDPASARQSAEDAVAFAESVDQQGICTGDYRETLVEQTRYARQVADSLRQRSRYDRCVRLLEQAGRSHETARQTRSTSKRQASLQAWRKALQASETAANSGHCKGVYQDKAVELRTRAQRQIDQLNPP